MGKWKEISKEQYQFVITNLSSIHWEHFGESYVGYYGGKPILREIKYIETTYELNETTVESFLIYGTK